MGTFPWEFNPKGPIPFPENRKGTKGNLPGLKMPENPREFGKTPIWTKPSV